ncbi:hypothetical protein [Streptomyces violascens]|uniref:hypothetical protein n=1 Tax=Streptomyces violascens TaxID=67381 RepID=UPI0016747FD7|nr:hypothetical protein [Streptomyces violascens]GGU52680.1 hypothetical protein GCM10010289_86060 [Streptomyces violascens]
MGPYASPSQPPRSRAVDSLRALVPDDADVIRVRGAAPNAANGWTWAQAEVLGAYQWPPYPGEALRPLSHTPDDNTHASLTICEFLTTFQYAPIVRLVRANDATYTFSIRLSCPRWEDWDDV